MRTRSWLLVSVVLSIPLGLALPSALGSPAPAAAANEALEAAMGQLQKSMKALGKGVSEETKAAALEELARMQEAFLAAKVQVPDTAAAVDEKKRDAFVAEFRTTLLEALKLTCDAEIALVNGKYKEAEGILRGKLGGLKSSGHDTFKGDEK